jgi:hypothetical protein
MMNNPIRIISTSALALIMSACGQGYKSTAGTTSGVGATTCNSASCGATGGVPTPTAQQQLSRVDMQGTAGKGIFASMTFIKIDAVAQTLDLQLPMGSNPAGINLVYNIPQIPGATAGMLQDSSGNWFLGVKIPLSAIVHGVSLGNSQALPNGNPLPGVPGGALPSVELNIASIIPIHLYIGKNVAAAFIELPQTDKYMAYLSYIPFQLSFDLKNSTNTVVGVLAPIAPVTTGGGNYSGGVFVATKMPTAVANIIDSIF